MITAPHFSRVALQIIARAGLLPPAVWRRLPVETVFLVSLPDGNAFRYSALPNDATGRALWWRGLKSWQPETLRIFHQLSKKAQLVLDIGANTGVFTLLACAANPHLKVISFEPVPRIYNRLREHVRLNGYEGRCQVRNEAVSNRIGVTQFHVPFGDVPTSASLQPNGFRGVQGELIEVHVTTVDSVCATRERVDLVKIDVEGYEDKVLEGMRRTLATSKPTVIVECNPDGPYQAIEAILGSFGYRFFHLRKQGPEPCHKITPDESEQFRNFLCTAHDNWEILR